MDRKILNYLNAYSKNVEHDPRKINRLLISTFLAVNNISSAKNTLIREYCIQEKDPDHPALCELLKKENAPTTLEELIEAFEFVISPADKVVTGAVYTPENIRQFIIDHVLKDATLQTTICDPACGCGGFLLSAARQLKKTTNYSYKHILENCIFGLDIYGYSTTRAKLLLCLLALMEGEDEENINFCLYEGNALSFDWKKHIQDFNSFSIIVGNPPYVASRNIDEKSKALLSKWTVCSSGHPDLYIPFFQIGLNWLKPKGVLGFITMNTFFKSLNGKALRKYFQASTFGMKILDFGSTQVFRSKSTYTCICFITKTSSTAIQYKKLEDLNLLKHSLNGFDSIPYLNLKADKGWNLQKTHPISSIESIGKPFSELFKTRNGIATLMNDIYIFNPVREDNNYYYLLKDEWEYPIEKMACKEIVNTNRFTQADSIRGIKEKIIFPYVYEKDKRVPVALEERFFRDVFPGAYAYLKNHRDKLATRDKGGGAKYEPWFSYGRNQCLDKFKYKLFFPHITSSIPNFVLNDDEDLLFVNGLAAVSDKRDDLLFVKKLLSTKLFWFYVSNTSKPYGSGFYSLSKNYIKNFGVYQFTTEEKKYIINERNPRIVDAFIETKYKIRY
jgi:adenine-specific DNA-methyltransferase